VLIIVFAFIFCTAYRYYIFWCNCNFSLFSQIKYI